MATELNLYDCKNPYMMETAMNRELGESMSTATAKPMQQPPSQEKKVKVIYTPRYGISAHAGRGLSVDVSALPKDEKDDPQRG
jgi:hypothetical protein